MGIRRILAALCLLAFLPLANTACIGQFSLTRKLYNWNRTFNPDRWLQWVAFLGLNVILVYPFSLAFDAVFANSVEFWTGSNPVAWNVGETRVALGPNGETLRATVLAPGYMRVEAIEIDGTVHVREITAEGDVLVARDADGVEVGRLHRARIVAAR
jgi:hypothetical protein